MILISPNLSGSASVPFARPGLIGRMWVMVPTFLVLTGLTGLAYWGHESGWKFTHTKPDANPADRENTEAIRPVIRFVAAESGSKMNPLPGQNVRFDFQSAKEAEAFGIDITSVWPTTLTEQVTAGGEVIFDQTRVAKLSTRAGGVTRKVFKVAGDPVNLGEVVALVDSPDVGRSKLEFQQALVQLRLRERRRDELISAKSASSPAIIREAESALKEAEVRLLAASQTLTNLGLPIKPKDYRGLAPNEAIQRIRFLGVEDVIARFDAVNASSNLLPLRAPFGGIMLSADVVAGEVVETGKSLFVIVDPTRVWVNLHINPEDTWRLTTGQTVFYRPDGASQEFKGLLLSVGTMVDESTRTVPIRAEFENTQGSLRASTIGRGRVVIRKVPNAVVVPHEAVHSFLGQGIVFVRNPDFLTSDGLKSFHARVVTTGGKDERNTEIVEGLSQGEIVAAKGSARLLGELTRATTNR